MRIRTGLIGTLHCRFYSPRHYETIALLFLNITSRHSHCNVSDRVFEHVAVAGSCSIHWPGEYPPTPPSPHSLNNIEVSWYGNWTVCSWVGESGGKNNACNANDKPPSWVHHPLAGFVTRFTRGRVQEFKNARNSVTVQTRTHVCMNFFDHKDVGNHLLQYVHKSWNTLYIYVYIYRCPRRKGPNFGRVFLRSNYTDITQNTYIQSSMVTEILAREKWGRLWCLRTLVCPWRHIVICTWPSTR